MQVERLQVGSMEVNCYLVFGSESREAVIIDPGADADRILQVVEDKQLAVQSVINTHGHVDHIGANREVIEATGAELVIHKADAGFLTDPELNFSTHLGQEVTSPQADSLLEEGSVVGTTDFELKVIHTPGHTPGGICLQGEEVLFTGDTLFAMGIGRSDFPYASREELRNSLDKLMQLTGNLQVYPGHGPVSTLEKVKKKNMYL